MNYVYIGKIVSTHGIRGEVRIVSDFELKEQVFKKDMPLYIGGDKMERKIQTYRPHKMYNMVTLEGISTIEQAQSYKGENVYVTRDCLSIPTYLEADLIGMEVYVDEICKGSVKELIKSKAHPILVLTPKAYRIPLIPEFIIDVDIPKKRIMVRSMKGLFDEN